MMAQCPTFVEVASRIKQICRALQHMFMMFCVSIIVGENVLIPFAKINPYRSCLDNLIDFNWICRLGSFDYFSQMV